MQIATNRIRTVVIVLAILSMKELSRAEAQDTASRAGRGAPWRTLDAIGYGALGLGLGFALGYDEHSFGPSASAVVLMLAGSVGGIAGGARIGSGAERAFTAGSSLTRAHRSAVVAGAVLAGATLGAVAAIPFINSEGSGTPLGTDEQTFGVLALGGAGIAGVYVWNRRRTLAYGRVTAAPVYLGNGRHAVRAKVRF